jgi:hypothetical protein
MIKSFEMILEDNNNKKKVKAKKKYHNTTEPLSHIGRQEGG